MEQIEEEFAKVFANLARSMGLPDASVNVFAVLYLEPEEISMDEVAKRTGYSLASISTTLRQLEALRMVERSRKPGSAKVYLYMHKNLGRIHLQKMRAMQEMAIHPLKTMLPGMIARYKKKTKTSEDQAKLAIIKDYQVQIIAFEKLVNRWAHDLEDFANTYGARGT
jgi:DNA-binding transcriptional regulator GbsR (MarR family)